MSVGSAARSAAGAAAGLLAGLGQAALLAAVGGELPAAGPGGADQPALGVALLACTGGVLGVAYAWLFRPASYAESLMSGMAFGVLGWLALPLSLLPAAAGAGPRWEAAAVAAGLPALFGYLAQGALLGVGYHALVDQVSRRIGLEDVERPAPRSPRPVERRVVVLGGGFAGVATAQHLEKLFGADERVAITLVSGTNHLLFTPMLSEVTSSGVEAQHIGPPLRSFFRRTTVIQREAAAVDWAARAVRLAPKAGKAQPDVPFDHLVLALGAVPSFFGNQGVEAHAFTFKSLGDAILLRNHVIEMLERADAEPDEARRRELLTFVVAGGGFAGAELVGGLNDFVRGSLWYYPRARPDEVALVLVHSGQRILPEMSAELADYARGRLEARGVTCRLGVRVADAADGAVVLSSGETIRAATFVWTAGNMPHPLLRGLGLALDGRGAVRTDDTLAVLNGHAPRDGASADGPAGRPYVWAVGDCASIPDAITGKTAPPTAQHALREARTLAHNIHAAIHGKPLVPFRYRSGGALAVLGHQTACAEIYGLKFSGLFAWWLWRMVYLGKLPSLEKRVRVALDWIVDIFFPRDIVQVPLPEGPARTGVKGQEAVGERR
jgi:NADH dehydrogenase